MAVADPVSGILESPGACGADIVVGDGQSLAIPSVSADPISAFATRENMCAGCPDGSWVSPLTTGGKSFCPDPAGQRTAHSPGEGHFQYLFQPGSQCPGGEHGFIGSGQSGLKEMAQQSLQKAHYAYQQLMGLPGVGGFSGKPFSEFVLKLPQDREKVNEELLKHKIIGGCP